MPLARSPHLFRHRPRVSLFSLHALSPPIVPPPLLQPHSVTVIALRHKILASFASSLALSSHRHPLCASSIATSIGSLVLHWRRGDQRHEDAYIESFKLRLGGAVKFE